MNDDFFARMVSDEVKGKATPDQIRFLHLPENRGRWQQALIALVTVLDGQLRELDQKERDEVARFRTLGDSGLRLQMEAAAIYEERRRKVTKFRFHVNAKLDEVARMIAIEDGKLEGVAVLRRAIERHRQVTIANYEPTPADEDLWATLEGGWK